MIKEVFKGSINWANDPGYNLFFLREAERTVNTLVQERGYIYLNEIYQSLGLKWDPEKENILFRSDGDKYPGRFILEYFPGSELLLIHDSEEES